MRGIRTLSGPWFVAAAALLWGTDSIFRYPIADQVDATVLVFAEHLLGVVALAAWVGWRHRAGLLGLSRREWGAAAFVGVLGSAIATTIFTVSFLYVNPSVAVLLQKLQPVMVVLIAFTVLGERPHRGFYFWGALAVLAGAILSFPDLQFDLEVKRTRGVLFALLAAILWAASTVAGKVLLERMPPAVGTFWRYLFGLLALCLMLALPGVDLNLEALSRPRVAQAIVYVSFLSGIIPMALYYAGLKRTRASVVTFIELTYPISSVVLNALVLGMPLGRVQVASAVVLIAAVVMISRLEPAA